MSMDRIAIVNQPWGYIRPPVNEGGSIPVLLYELSRRIARKAKHVTYYTRGDFRARETVDQSVVYHYIPIIYDKIAQKLGHRLNPNHTDADPRRPKWASKFSYFGYGVQLARTLRRHGAEVVHLNNLSQFIPIIRRRNPDAVIAIQMHCEWLSQLAENMIGPRLEQADLIMGVSDFITDKIRRRFPHLADRCRTLYNGVDTDRFAFSGERFERQAPEEIVYVGRVTPEKGIHVLIDAFRKVRKQYPKIKLTIVGPDLIVPPGLVVSISGDPAVEELLPLYDSAKYRAFLREKMLGLEDSITFTGLLPHGESLARHYQRADVCVAPAIWDEPFGMPVVEAMSTGAPMVATRVGAHPELVKHGVTGMLVERNNVRELASAIVHLLDRPQLRREMGVAARAAACSRFHWDDLAERLLKYYEQAAARRRQNAGAAIHEDQESDAMAV